MGPRCSGSTPSATCASSPIGAPPPAAPDPAQPHAPVAFLRSVPVAETIVAARLRGCTGGGAEGGALAARACKTGAANRGASAGFGGGRGSGPCPPFAKPDAARAVAAPAPLRHEEA